MNVVEDKIHINKPQVFGDPSNLYGCECRCDLDPQPNKLMNPRNGSRHHNQVRFLIDSRTNTKKILSVQGKLTEPKEGFSQEYFLKIYRMLLMKKETSFVMCLDTNNPNETWTIKT